MNVLIVYPWESFWAMGENSGVASFFNAAHAYVDHGHAVDVVLPGRPGAPAGEQYHGMMLTRVPFAGDPLDPGRGHIFGLAQRLWRYWDFRRRMVTAARRVSRGRPPDVVVGLGPHAAPVARAVARDTGVPNVTRLFGQALILHMDGTGGIRDPLRFYANFPEVVAFRTACAALIVHDDGSRGDLVARRLGVPPDRLHFWRDGVDLPAVERSGSPAELRQRLGCGPDAVLAVSVGRLSPEKNLDRLFAGFARAAEEVAALELVFVGDGPSRGDIEAEVRRAGLDNRVRFAGHVTRDALDDVFDAADMIVSVSDRTNMTNAVLEAMAYGVPPVALDCGSTASVVIHERTGLLVERPSAESVAAAISRLATDAKLRQRLGEAAHAHVRDEFERVEERVAREVELVIGIARNAGGSS